MRSLRVFPPLAFAALFSLISTALAGQAFNFRKIADNSTPVPGGTGTFGTLGGAIIEGATVTFYGTDANEKGGIYRFANGTISRLVGDGDRTIPSNPNSPTVQAIGGYAVSGESLAFTALVRLPGASLGDRTCRVDGGTITEVSSDLHVALDIDGANIAAVTLENSLEGLKEELVVYGANPRQAGPTVLRPTTYDTRLSLSGTTVTYSLNAPDDPGIFAGAAGGSVPLVTKATPLPGFAGGPVSAFGGAVAEGNDLAFTATTKAVDRHDVPVNTGILLRRDGAVKLIADTDTRMPGSTKKFTQFSYPALSGGKVAFSGDNMILGVGFRPPTEQGVYFYDGRKLQRVVGPGSKVDGKKVAGPEDAPKGFLLINTVFFSDLENDVIAMDLTFTDGSYGIYLATPGANTDSFTVNSFGDLPDNDVGDGVASTGGLTADGQVEVTLRAAMMEANAKNGENAIDFKLPGPGPFVISPATPLPAMANPVTIDATGQPGYIGTPIVQINGAGAGASTNGIQLAGGKSTLRGVVIQQFGGSGIVLTSGSKCTVENCYVGTDVSGVNARPNGTGILVESKNHTIGGLTEAARNVISGNTGAGIKLSDADDTRIFGNYIGTDRDGTQELPNVIGVEVTEGNDMRIGGAADGAGNVISGNSETGILVRNAGNVSPARTKIEGNRIGTSASGMSAVPNPIGVFLRGVGNTTIGGRKPGMGNLISGNPNVGVAIEFNTAERNIVEGNIIGLRADGLAALPNGVGVGIKNAPKTLIGGPKDNAGNVISGNLTHGVVVEGELAVKNRIEGNIIGLDAAGVDAVPNQNGVLISGAVQTSVGGERKGMLNVISGNTTGIAILGTAASGNTVQRNFIGMDRGGAVARPNTQVGIDLVGGNDTLIGGPPGPDGPVGNVIGGSAVGISIANVAGAPENVRGIKVQGNAIGTNALGEALPNGIGIDISQFTESLIGGPSSRLSNTIAFNLTSGIRNNGGVSVVIVHNSIHSTANGFGISGQAVEPAPLLTGFTVLPSGKTQISGTLNGTAGTKYRVEFYSNDVADPAGFGEGQTFLGFREYAGGTEFRVAVPRDARNISATATSRDSTDFVNTSTFSNTLAAPTGALPEHLALLRRTGDARTVRFVEADGDAVTVRSGRHGTVFLSDNGGLTLERGNARGSLAISVQRGPVGDGRAAIGSLVVHGDLRRLSAPGVDFLGIRVEGLLGRLTIGDLLAGAHLIAGGTSADRTRITARNIGSGAFIELGSALDRLTADSVRDAAITAPRVGGLHIREGSETVTIGDTPRD